jgi:parvulin-like peptidyl-prolyl isomerase
VTSLVVQRIWVNIDLAGDATRCHNTHLGRAMQVALRSAEPVKFRTSRKISMESKPFITVDKHPISLQQALQYLQAKGTLGAFISDILSQYVLEQELQKRGEGAIDRSAIEQAIIDFRLQNQLTDPQKFQVWLQSRNLDFAGFFAQVQSRFQQETLKAEVAEPKLQEYFIERKLFLDRVVLSRIIVDNQELAEELYSQIVEEGAKFEQLAQEYSLADDRIANGMMGPVSRGTMPDVLRAAVDSARAGEVLKPLELDGRWGVFRVEQVLSASLENAQLKQTLRDELFERWLAEKIQQMNVKVQVEL